MIFTLKNYAHAFLLTALLGVLLYARVGFYSYNFAYEGLILFASFLAFRGFKFPNFGFRTFSILTAQPNLLNQFGFIAGLAAVIFFLTLEPVNHFPPDVLNNSPFGLSSIAVSAFLLLSSMARLYWNEPIHFMKKCIKFRREGYRYEIDYHEIEDIAFGVDTMRFRAGGVFYEIAIKPLKGDEIQEILKRFENRKQIQLVTEKSSRQRNPFQHVFKTAFTDEPRHLVSDKALIAGCFLFIGLMLLITLFTLLF